MVGVVGWKFEKWRQVEAAGVASSAKTKSVMAPRMKVAVIMIVAVERM
jgi:hypothetical protein